MVCVDWEIDGTILPVIMFLHSWAPIPGLVESRDSGPDSDTLMKTAMILLQHTHIRLAHKRNIGVLSALTAYGPAGDRLEKSDMAPVYNLLNLSSLCHSTDPRDHYFAILVLAKEDDAIYLSADYNKSLNEVSQESVTHLIKMGYGVSILSRASLSIHCKTLYHLGFQRLSEST
jgi:hypothetical protein